jgi:hypothetical protein
MDDASFLAFREPLGFAYVSLSFVENGGRRSFNCSTVLEDKALR